MNTNKNQRKKRFAITCCLLLSIFLIACGNEGKLDEGDCKCRIFFADIPKEFTMLDENLQKEFQIRVTLENITTEKKYNIILNQENNFDFEAFLNPGTYRVASVYSGMSSYTGISLASDTERAELTRDTSTEIRIFIDNREDFTNHWMAVQPMPEMLLADKYSALIQINRKVISVTDILPELSVTYDQPVPSNKKIELTDTERGVTVTLQNKTAEPLSWQKCEVIGIEVTRNTVVFPAGITLGMTPSQVCHKTDGLYGEPTKFSGSALFGWAFDDTYAVYTDSLSGNKLTLCISADGSYIRSIRYELAQYE